jgi:hypothetical protein
VHPFWKPHPNAPLYSKGTAGIVANIRVHRNAVLHNSFPHQFNGTKRLTFFSPAISAEKNTAVPRGVGGLFGYLQ